MLLTYPVGVSCGARQPASGSAGFTLTLSPPTVARVTFDPQAPPPKMPTLGPDETAVAIAEFRVAVGVEVMSGGSERLADGSRRAKVTVTNVQVDTTLHTTIYLPPDATSSLAAHEEGHRLVAERVYAAAETPFRALVEPYLGRVLTGDGETLDAARDAATRDLVEELSGAWLAHTHGISEPTNILYDEITDHGRAVIAADDAVELALQRWQAERPGAQ